MRGQTLLLLLTPLMVVLVTVTGPESQDGLQKSVEKNVRR